MFQNQNSQSRNLSEKEPEGKNYLSFTEENLQAKSQINGNLLAEKDECLQYEGGILPHLKLQKWINFVQFHQIDSSDIWEGKLSLPLLLFVDIFQKKLGYRFSISQMNCLKQISQDECLRRQHFFKCSLWTKKKQHKNLLTSLTSSTSHKTFVATMKKSVQSPKKILNNRIFSRQSQAEKDRLTEKDSMISHFSKTKTDKSRKLTTFEQITKTFLQLDFAQQPIQDNKLEALRSVMQMNALQKKWQFIVMAGEMNKWLQQLPKDKKDNSNSIPAYKIINHEDVFTIIKSDNNEEEIIPEIVFLKKYSAMKKRKQRPQTKLEVKQIIFANLGALSETNNKQPNRNNYRDKELNQALLQIMRMRNTLQHQYKIFAEAAINT